MEEYIPGIKEFKTILDKTALVNKNNTFLEDNECSICFDSMEHSKNILRCGHSFHEECINEWIKIKPNCPLCRIYIQLNLKIRARKIKNIFVRFMITGYNGYILIEKYYLDIKINAQKIKYSEIRFLKYRKNFKITYNKDIRDINGVDNKHIIFKIIDNSNYTLFNFLKNKISIIN